MRANLALSFAWPARLRMRQGMGHTCRVLSSCLHAHVRISILPPSSLSCQHAIALGRCELVKTSLSLLVT